MKPFLTRRAPAKSPKRQAGVSILQILIGSAVGAIALVATINAVQGQRADAEQTETVAFITSQLTQTLSSIYYNSGRSYGVNVAPKTGLYALGTAGNLTTAGSTTAGTVAAALVDTKGLRAELPSGDIWSIASGTNPARQVNVYFGCAQGNGTAAIRCASLAENIRGMGSRMILDPANDVVVNLATDGAEYVRVLLDRPA